VYKKFIKKTKQKTTIDILRVTNTDSKNGKSTNDLNNKTKKSAITREIIIIIYTG